MAEIDYSALVRRLGQIAPGANVESYNTALGGQEPDFRAWVQANNVPFDPTAGVTDYDMRGFYKALVAGDPRARSAIDPNDKKLHYPDYWKTPYHKTFSRESQFANRATAPHWNDLDQLISAQGQVLFDDRYPRSPLPGKQ